MKADDSYDKLQQLEIFKQIIDKVIKEKNSKNKN